MPDGCKLDPDGEAAFTFCSPQTPASLQDIQLGLERAWRLMLRSQIDQALTVLESVDRHLDELSPPVAMRYRAASHLVRSAVLAFQDDSLAVLAVVISQVFVEGGAGLGSLLRETRRRTESFGSAAQSLADRSRLPGIDSDAITARERDVLSMISQGYSNKRIARTLDISPETVKSHVKHIFSKLDVTARSEAVSRALSLRLLEY